MRTGMDDEFAANFVQAATQQTPAHEAGTYVRTTYFLGCRGRAQPPCGRERENTTPAKHNALYDAVADLLANNIVNIRNWYHQATKQTKKHTSIMTYWRCRFTGVCVWNRWCVKLGILRLDFPAWFKLDPGRLRDTTLGVLSLFDSTVERGQWTVSVQRSRFSLFVSKHVRHKNTHVRYT